MQVPSERVLARNKPGPVKLLADPSPLIATMAQFPYISRVARDTHVHAKVAFGDEGSEAGIGTE